MKDKSLLVGQLCILILISWAAYAGPKKISAEDMMIEGTKRLSLQPTCIICNQLCESHDGALCDRVALRALLQEIFAQEGIEFEPAHIVMAYTIRNTENE